MKPHILRVNDRSGRWVISDGAHTLTCGTSSSLKNAVRRWEAVHGKPPEGYTRVAGDYCRARAEAFVENLRGQLPRVCRVCRCTDDDCAQCVAVTGHACHWVDGEDPPLCSRCAAERAARRSPAGKGGAR